MEQTPKEMLKAYVDSQKFNSTTEIMDAMKEKFRDVLQQVMESELDAESGYEKSQRMSGTAEEKILGLYACGMSQRDISEQIKGLYDVEISPELVSKISEKIMPEVTAWQDRPLEAVYPHSQVQRCIVHQIRSSSGELPSA